MVVAFVTAEDSMQVEHMNGAWWLVINSGLALALSEANLRKLQFEVTTAVQSIDIGEGR